MFVGSPNSFSNTIFPVTYGDAKSLWNEVVAEPVTTAREPRALPRRTCELKNFACAAPGEGEPGAAVAVIVNDGATIAETIAFEAYT